MNVEQVLEMLKDERASWGDPGSYMDDEWYIKCDAKYDILGDMIDRIESQLLREKADKLTTS